MEGLTCPLCGASGLQNILGHYKIHEKGITGKQFRLLYPEWIGPLQIDHRAHGAYKCPYCDKIYTFNNGLSIHLKKVHPEEWATILYNKKIQKQHKQNIKGQTCSICNKIKIDLKQHVECSHNITWKEYCSKYNHDISKTKIVDEEYKQKLSTNKKAFYHNTERGKELRLLQSQLWSGKNNIIHQPNILEKAIYTRAIHGAIPSTNFKGIPCWYKKINRYTRSFEELRFIIFLEMNGIEYEYEPKFVMKYYNEDKGFITSYLPDFYIDGIYYELKTDSDYKRIINDIQHSKYFEISKAFQKINVKFEITTLNQYATKMGFNVKSVNIENKIISEYNNKNIKFTCKKNSSIIKRITGSENLETTWGVTLYD